MLGLELDCGVAQGVGLDGLGIAVSQTQISSNRSLVAKGRTPVLVSVRIGPLRLTPGMETLVGLD